MRTEVRKEVGPVRTELRNEGSSQAPAGRSRAPGAVVVEGLRKSYGAVQAAREVSFTVQDGEIFALLGPNGAGNPNAV